MHVGIVQAAPLVHRSAAGDLTPVDALELDAEKRAILRAARDSGRAICVKATIGTPHSLQQLLTRGCHCLHFTGHGGVDAAG